MYSELFAVTLFSVEKIFITILVLFILASTKIYNSESLKEAKSARDCFRILYSEKLFTKWDVTFMQFLLRRTGCKELDNKCAEYAKGQNALGFYEKQPGTVNYTILCSVVKC